MLPQKKSKGSKVKPAEKLTAAEKVTAERISKALDLPLKNEIDIQKEERWRDQQTLAKGMKVCITGLRKTPEFNGLEGFLKKYSEQEGRWLVKMLDATSKSIKPENLRPCTVELHLETVSPPRSRAGSGLSGSKEKNNPENTPEKGQSRKGSKDSLLVPQGRPRRPSVSSQSEAVEIKRHLKRCTTYDMYHTENFDGDSLRSDREDNDDEKPSSGTQAAQTNTGGKPSESSSESSDTSKEEPSDHEVEAILTMSSVKGDDKLTALLKNMAQIAGSDAKDVQDEKQLLKNLAQIAEVDAKNVSVTHAQLTIAEVDAKTVTVKINAKDAEGARAIKKRLESTTGATALKKEVVKFANSQVNSEQLALGRAGFQVKSLSVTLSTGQSHLGPKAGEPQIAIKKVPSENSSAQGRFGKRDSTQSNVSNGPAFGKKDSIASSNGLKVMTQVITAAKILAGRRASSQVFDVLKAHNSGDHYDLVVLGAGPAGVKAAVECAQRGFRVGLVDTKQEITGAPTGVHSKGIREAALAGAKTWSEVKVVVDKVMWRARESTKHLLNSFHVEVLHGAGQFLDHDMLLVASGTAPPKQLKADCIVIATGSRSSRLPYIPFHLPGVFDSDSINGLSYIPKNMVVQGAGIAGLEYALIFSLLGSKVTVVHHSNHIVDMMDKALGKALLERLKAHNVEVRLNTPVKSVKAALPDGCEYTSPLLVVDAGQFTLACDCLLSVTGRCGVTDNLGLEKLRHLGMRVGSRQMIEVDESQHTGVGNIYAVGDVAGGRFATVGQTQAMRAIEKHFGFGAQHNRGVMPYAVWTIPEIAWAGMTEQMAEAKRIDFGIAHAEYKDTVRGMVHGGDGGFLKLIFDKKDGKVLGVHICGENACDLVNYGADAVNKATIYDILHFVFPTMTYHELYQIAAYEAKVRIKGVKSVSAATAWGRLRIGITKKLEEENTGMTMEEALWGAFTAFDTDSSGALDADELKEAFDMLGFNIPKNVVQEMMEEVDDNGDGEIDFEEFRQHIIGDDVNKASEPTTPSSISTLNMRNSFGTRSAQDDNLPGMANLMPPAPKMQTVFSCDEMV